MGVTNYATLDGEIVSVSIDGVRKDLIPDPLGSVAALVDSTGTITDSFTYWPYGEERTRTGTTEISTRFVGAWGYYWDNPKRDYVRARYLEKNQTRWLTVDPLWPGEPAYGYVGSGPISMFDPSGTIKSRPCHRKLGECARNCAPKLVKACIEEKVNGRWVMTVCSCLKPPTRKIVGEFLEKLLKGVMRTGGAVGGAAQAGCAAVFADCAYTISQSNGGDIEAAICICWNSYNDSIEDANRIQRACFNLACGNVMDYIDIALGCGDKKWRY